MHARSLFQSWDVKFVLAPFFFFSFFSPSPHSLPPFASTTKGSSATDSTMIHGKLFTTRAPWRRIFHHYAFHRFYLSLTTTLNQRRKVKSSSSGSEGEKWVRIALHAMKTLYTKHGSGKRGLTTFHRRITICSL